MLHAVSERIRLEEVAVEEFLGIRFSLLGCLVILLPVLVLGVAPVHRVYRSFAGSIVGVVRLHDSLLAHFHSDRVLPAVAVSISQKTHFSLGRHDLHVLQSELVERTVS